MADVIVVGAGPAGSIAARELSDYGFTVSLYEKDKLPRHKHGAGYVPCRALRALDSLCVDCRATFLQTVRGWRIQSGNETLDFDFDGPEDGLPGNTYREEFDFFLTRLAAESGARIIDSTRVLKIVIPRKEGEKYSVITEKGTEECEIILGADGARSIVRRQLGIPYPKRKWAVTIEAEVPVEAAAIDSYGEKNLISTNYVQSGIAWAFPKRKGKTVNVGLGVSAEEVRRMGESLVAVWKTLLQNQQWYRDQSVHPHYEIMPYKGTVDSLGKREALLLGDAAGLVDPVTGVGIPYAIESGINSAEAARLHFEGKIPLLAAYNDLMNSLLDELNIYALKLHDYFFVKNRMGSILRLTKKDKNLRKLMLDMSLGLISYKQVVEKFSLIRWFLTYLRSIFK